MIRIKILGFDPLRLELPEGDRHSTLFKVELPPITYVLLDLSMNGVIPDAPYIGAEVSGITYEMTFKYPVGVAEVVAMLEGAADGLKELHAEIQKEATEKGALL